MKTIKANNYAQAIKEIEGLDKELSLKVKEQIKDSDRKHNHILGVKVEDRPGQAKNKVTFDTIIVNDDKLRKLKKSFAFHGFSKIIILHDASQHVDEPMKEDDKNQDGETAEQKVARLEAENEALKASKGTESDKDPESGQGTEAGAKGGAGLDDILKSKEVEELENDYTTAMSGNKDEFVAFLDKYKIPQDEITNNEGRKNAITAYYNTKMVELSGFENQ